MTSDRVESPNHLFAAVLTRTPVATFLAVLALALLLATHIGSFAVANTVLLRVLPVEDLSRLVHIWDNIETGPGERRDYSVRPAHYVEWKKRQTTMASMGSFEPLSFNLTGVGEPVRLQGALVSHDLFPTFGVEPLLGRGIRESEDRPGEPPVALISYDLWHERFDGDPGAVGRKIRIDGLAHEVVGVLPKGFYHPWHTEIWISMRLDPESPKMRRGVLTVIGYMKPGVTIEEARADLRNVASELAKEHPESHAGWEITVPILRDQLVGEIEPKLLAFLAASVLLLVTACLPLALLLGGSAHAAAGNGERARWRALLPAGLALALPAGVLGYVLALAFTETVVATSPLVTFTSYFKTIHFDTRVVLYSVGTVVASGVLLAAFGAWLARPPGRTRLVAGVSVAVLLVTLAAAAWAGFQYWRQLNADYGFRSDGLLSMRFSLPAARYTDPQTRRDFFGQLLTRTRQLPRVTAAGVVTDPPFVIHSRMARHSVEGYTKEPGTILVVHHRYVSPGYLETLEAELIAGRTIEAGDTWEAPKVVVVNRSFAERYWPGQRALGKRVKQGEPDSERPWLSVVGVVGDFQEDGREPTIHQPSWYLPTAQYDDLWNASLVVRGEADPHRLVAPIRSELAALDAELPAYDVVTIAQLRDRFTLFRPRFLAIISALAVVLTMVPATAALSARRAVSGHVR